MVIVANYTRDLPCSILVLPEVDKPSLTHSNFLVAGMMKAMGAGLERAVTFHMESLQGTRNEFASGLAADVFLNTFGEGIPAQGDTALIVVELHVIHEERSKLLQVTSIVGIEQGRIERRNGSVEVSLRLDLFEGQYFLGLDG
jgi:hypothetical protein